MFFYNFEKNQNRFRLTLHGVIINIKPVLNKDQN